MTLGESISTCFQKYADFKGRARRSEFWWFFLFCAVSSLVLGFIPLLGQLYMLALLIPHLAVVVRRLHDTDRSAWWLLLLLPLLLPIAILGLAILLIMLFVIGLASAFGADSEIDAWTTDAWIMAAVNFAIFIVGTIPLLVFCARPGTIGPNRYGSDPLNSAPDVGGSPGRGQFCTRCGARLPQDGRFCTRCGTAI